MLVSGRTHGPSGQLYVYAKDDLVACPKGELDHMGPDAVPVTESGLAQTAALASSETETRPVKPAPKRKTKPASNKEGK